MMPEMAEGSLVIDDISHYETEKSYRDIKPDLLCAVSRKSIVVQKKGMPLKQLHNYDYRRAVRRLQGAINFYREIDRHGQQPVWRNIKAPWHKTPELSGSIRLS